MSERLPFVYVGEIDPADLHALVTLSRVGMTVMDIARRGLPPTTLTTAHVAEARAAYDAIGPERWHALMGRLWGIVDAAIADDIAENGGP